MIDKFESRHTIATIFADEKILSHPILLINDEFIILTEMDNTEKKLNKLLIDTGAQLSFLKYNSIKNKNKIDNKYSTNFRGILSCIKSHTLGTIESGIYIHNTFCPHEFHVISDQTTIGTADGILGSDFLIKYKSILDYDKKELRIFKPELVSRQAQENLKEKKDKRKKMKIENKSLPGVVQQPQSYNKEKAIQTKPSVPQRRKNNNFNESGELLLEARAENIIYWPSRTTEDVVIEKKQLDSGIFIGNSIETPNEGQIRMIILNARGTKYKLNKEKVEPVIRQLKEFDRIEKSEKLLVGNERKMKIKSLINLSHCNDEESKQVLEVCLKYDEIFYIKGDKLSSTNATTHRIPLIHGTLPINTKPYRLPYFQRETLEDEIQKLLQDGVIHPSQSPWCSPILLVPKKPDATGKRKWRLCIDFRKINEKTISDSYPLPPNITDILDQLGKATYFSTLDLERGYWQVKMEPNDREITAFKANGRLYEWLRMPMGVKNAAPTFQRMVNNILLGLQGEICFIYVDDLILYANDLKDHNEKLQIIFERLAKYHLKVNPEKCAFLRKEINFLGHIISNAGLYPDKRKVEAVQKFPIPRNQKDLKSFLGLASYYRKFIENFSAIVHPINNLLKKDVKFEWSEECHNAFETLKHKLTTAPILSFPDFSKPFIIRTDASNFAVGAILSQGKLREDLPIAYMSRSLNKHEIRYSTVEKELLAIVYAFKYFRPYVYLKHTVIVTDHQALVYIMNIKNPASRLMRWKLELAEYDFEVVHRPGIMNANADALSRIQIKPSELLGEEPHKSKLDEKYDKNVNVVTRSATKNSEPDSMEQTNENKLKNYTNIIERDDIHHNFKHDEAFVVYIVTDAINFPFNYVKNPTIFGFSPGKILRIDMNSIALYNSKTIDTKEMKKIWNLIRNAVIVRRINKIIIFMSKSDHDLYLKTKMMIGNTLGNTRFQIKIITNQLIRVLTNEDKDLTIKTFHDHALGGHLGVHATIDRVRQQYNWEGMNKDIKNYIDNCLICKKNKIIKHTRMPMKITSIANSPFEKIIMDCVGPIKESNQGNRFMITFQCDLTKYSECVATPDITAFTVAEVFVEKVVCKHGIPKILTTDQGTNFMSHMFQEVCRILKIDHVTSTIHMPSSVGQIERFHRTLATYLRIYAENRDSWDEWITFALFVYNTTKHSSTGYTPHFLVYGFDVQIPSNLKQNPAPIYNYDDYTSILKHKLKTAHEIARKNIINSKQANKQIYDKRENPINFQIGENILVINENKEHKFDELYRGPYEILDIPTEENCLIKIGRKTKLLHKNKLKKANPNE
jgi:hypothetical protein